MDYEVGPDGYRVTVRHKATTFARSQIKRRIVSHSPCSARLRQHRYVRHWTINGRFLSQPVTGVQRYAREIVGALDGLLAAGHPLGRGLDIAVALPRAARCELPLQYIRVRSAGRGSGHAWEQLSLPGLVDGGLVSLANTGPLAVGRQIVCIHDLNTYLAPDSYSWRFRLLYRGLLPVLGRRAARITTVSRFSAEAIASRGVAPAQRITVAPNGHEHGLAWHAQHSAASRAAAGPDTVLVIGSPAPHKNVAMLLSLAPELAAHGLRLAVIGARDGKVFADVASSAMGAGNVLWLGRLGDGELAALLESCLCLAFPSWTEGFGLPPLEAMTRGCPVVVSDAASLPEVCADAALYAAPDDPPRWLAHMLELRRNPDLRAAMVARGHVAAARFSWRRSAEIYLELMADLDGVSVPPDPTAASKVETGLTY
jgi:glycosyltransferase involved in cell wall biosynthesis